MATSISWSDTRDTLPANPSDFWWDWLSKPYKLSEAFKRVATVLSVDVISQQFENILPDEMLLLTLEAHEKPFLRQVYILGDDQRFEYARVIIPTKTYEKHFSQFEDLGSNLIGENLLYAYPGMKRSGFEYAALRTQDPRFEVALAGLEGERPDVLWIRRSIFWLDDLPLAVIEVFLPGIPPFRMAE
ncbi:MAG: chorismate lyase [Gammaproteobacteria bacterium]